MLGNAGFSTSRRCQLTDGPPNPGAGMRRTVGAIRHPLTALAAGVLDFRVTGREHLPDGPYVLAANHFSFIDPVLVSLAAGRSIRYLAVGGIFERSRAFARVLAFFGAIPLPAGRLPVAAIRAALDELVAGHPVGVFPEGRRVARWGDGPVRGGAAWLALASGVPLVPVAVLGSDGTLSPTQPKVRRTAVRVWIEPPLDPMDFVDREHPVGAITEAWVTSVAVRLDPWQAAADERQGLPPVPDAEV